MMRTTKLSVIVLSLLTVFLSGGCSELQDARIQNRIQADKIRQLDAELTAAQLELKQCREQLAEARASGGVEVDALKQQVAALEKAIKDKEKLIASMQGKLWQGAALPVELSTALEDFAKDSDIVEYDAARGIVKFKSDLLFEKGSDQVTSEAKQAVQLLANILNSAQAQEFDIIVAGHTDDIPILRPLTRAAHPTNWHLSAHRAISVLDVMTGNGIDAKRISIRGFGEFRPVEPNAAGNKGNPKNRRVEIYIIPKGA